MITRTLESKIQDLARYFPILTVTGPRQAGKTTLCRMAFPDHGYVSLELPDSRDYAMKDPRGFLADHPAPLILDEVQRVPHLLSYLQVMVDQRPGGGQFVLTGSADLSLLKEVTQTLAGRTGIATLLPCSFSEVQRFANPPCDLLPALWSGGFPAVYDRGIPPPDWYQSYIATYVERDVRQVLKIGDLDAFRTFLQMCAGRTGQLLNLSQLGADCGVSHNTARAWLSVLEAGFVVFRVPPLHSNRMKRLVKTPKLHFYDTGLACALLGIRSEDQLRMHPLRGPLFESWVVSEILKSRLHRGLPPDLCFFRDRRGFEVDVMVELATELMAIEVKSGRTYAPDFHGSLVALREKHDASGDPRLLHLFVVYGGDTPQQRHGVTVIPWKDVAQSVWW